MSTEFAGCSNDIEDDNISYDDEDELKVYETICDDPLAELQQFQCDICDNRFKTKEQRNVHIEDHFKSYECPNCTRSFVGDRAFEYHTRNGKCKTAVTPTLFSCSLCNEKVFKSKSALKMHETDVHGCAIETDRITCEQCQTTFAQLRYLRKHIYEVHNKLTQFNCSVCMKTFNRRSNLTEHMLIHDQKYLAPCDVCGKSYRTKSALRLHQRTHTGEKPYNCDICLEKSYAYNTDLKRHKQRAHGVIGSRFPCTKCGQMFYEPKFLNKHIHKYHRVTSDSEEIA